jgi:hypothetical protein
MHMAVSQISLPRRSASVLAWQNNTKSTLIRSKTLLNAALIQARFKIVHLIAGFLRNHFELLEVVRCNGQSLGRATVGAALIIQTTSNPLSYRRPL